jgi:hypothetical protein
VKKIKKNEDILKYLQLGTHIPIWYEFHDCILKDFKFFNVKFLLLEEKENPLGTCLLFSKDEKNLYFGYFNILNNNPKGINYLIKYLIEFAENRGYQKITGPINLPAIIYGFGFMQEGSSDTLFIGKSVNPPIYYQSFLDHNFQIKHKELTFCANPMLKFDPWKLNQYNFDDYKFFYPKNLKEFRRYKDDFLKTHAKNLPSSARITPNPEGVIENYARFVLEYGYPFMIGFVKYKPTDKIISSASYLPNPFRTNSKGIYDSCVLFSWVVEPEHRRNGITQLIYGATSLLLWEKGIRFLNGTVGMDNEANIGAAKKIGGKLSRTHLILEYIL